MNGLKDPVCGMDVDPHIAKHRTEYRGQTYYFCSARCRERFEAEPQKYLAPEPGKAEPVPEGTIYTCPMHPEIRQVGPGSCPICGMALEPVLATAESGPNPELVDMTRRFWIGLVLSLPVLALEMTHQAIVLERGTVVHAGPSAALAADQALLDRFLGVGIEEGA